MGFLRPPTPGADSRIFPVGLNLPFPGPFPLGEKTFLFPFLPHEENRSFGNGNPRP